MVRFQPITRNGHCQAKASFGLFYLPPVVIGGSIRVTRKTSGNTGAIRGNHLMAGNWRQFRPRRHVLAGREAARVQPTLSRFRGTLRGYDASSEGMWRVNAITEVIAASRAVVEVHEPLLDDDFATLSRIRDRYRAFATADRLPVLARYSDARALLAVMFF